MEEVDRPFGPWLDATMRARGLSQAAVAREIGVADAQVSRWRRGMVTPSMRYLQRIAEAFEVPRAGLERMVGYPRSEGGSDPERKELDPEREAEIQALQARLRDILEQQLPPSLWPVYGEAFQVLAVELRDSFNEVMEEAKAQAADNIGFRLHGKWR
jgi:transcriptional regulator with XRE-family HTH domain